MVVKERMTSKGQEGEKGMTRPVLGRREKIESGSEGGGRREPVG